MLLKKKYCDRHRVLKALQEKQEEGWRPDSIGSEDIELSGSEIAELARLREKDVWAQIDFLAFEKEIVVHEKNDFSIYYFICQKGTVSYYDRKYIYTGRKELLNDIYDWMKTVSTIVLLIIATITFILNIISTKNNTKEIQKLKVETNAISDSLKAQSNHEK